MATMDEYKAVHGGKEPPSRTHAMAEFGDGGCNVIFKDKGGVIGRWSSWEAASQALNQLQKLGFGYDYRLQESHEWVKAAGYTSTCSFCSISRHFPALAGTDIDSQWPYAC